MSFGSKIISWYRQNGRDLPWRQTHDPYKIWISEIILQQTRVKQGLTYYLKFIREFPNVKKLASAREEKVLKLWQGLGYYSRARNAHHSAKEIVKKFGGKFPERYKDILSLKGIGDYTAAAIASFAYGQRQAVVDGNVFRLLSRFLGIRTPVNTSKAKVEFLEAATRLMAGHSPPDFNQAIMEFGALHCRPINPQCNTCPISHQCFAFSKNKVKTYPVKLKNMKTTNRYFHYLFIRKNNEVILNKRRGNDIWKNLYDFPLIETLRHMPADMLLRHPDWKKYFSGKPVLIVNESKIYRHQLTHQKLFLRFYEISPYPDSNRDYPDIPFTTKVKMEKIDQFPVPRPIEIYLKSKDIHIMDDKKNPL